MVSTALIPDQETQLDVLQWQPEPDREKPRKRRFHCTQCGDVIFNPMSAHRNGTMVMCEPCDLEADVLIYLRFKKTGNEDTWRRDRLNERLQSLTFEKAEAIIKLCTEKVDARMRSVQRVYEGAKVDMGMVPHGSLTFGVRGVSGNQDIVALEVINKLPAKDWIPDPEAPIRSNTTPVHAAKAIIPLDRSLNRLRVL